MLSFIGSVLQYTFGGLLFGGIALYMTKPARTTLKTKLKFDIQNKSVDDTNMITKNIASLVLDYTTTKIDIADYVVFKLAKVVISDDNNQNLQYIGILNCWYCLNK